MYISSAWSNSCTAYCVPPWPDIFETRRTSKVFVHHLIRKSFSCVLQSCLWILILRHFVLLNFFKVLKPNSTTVPPRACTLTRALFIIVIIVINIGSKASSHDFWVLFILFCFYFFFWGGVVFFRLFFLWGGGRGRVIISLFIYFFLYFSCTHSPFMTCRFGSNVTAPSAAVSWPFTGCILAPQLSLARNVNSEVVLTLRSAFKTLLALSSFANITTTLARSFFNNSKTNCSILESASSRRMVKDWATHIPKMS